MVNFILVEQAARAAASQILSDEKLELAIAKAVCSALAVYDREKEKEKQLRKKV